MRDVPEPSRREIARYLGYHGEEPDAQVREAIERCLSQLMEQCRPKEVHRTFDLTVGEDGLLSFGGCSWMSRNLAKNLENCGKVVLFAATIGQAPDRLIRRASVEKVSDMVIYQAASAAMIEAWCDRLNLQIKEDAEKEGLYVRPRFSPGYGDLSLTVQRDVIRLLDTPRAIGVTLTESCLMAPSKSVTAVIGLSKEERPCPLSGCEICSMADCPYRRNSA